MAIFKFNNSNATLSNCIKIEVIHGHAYGLCFSPDNSKLYTGSEFFGDIILPPLYQYDLTNYNQASIQSSQFLVHQDSVWYGHMQIGIDNKIYFARGTGSLLYGNADSIGVINNPNLPGIACSLNLNSVSLNTKQSYASLPNFDQAYFYPLLNNSCVTEVEEISINHFKIYPNPTINFMIIENIQGFDFEMQIFDVNGKIIETSYISAFETKNINTTQLSSGIYILQLKNNSKVLNYKLIKN
ncbi:MAG: T9SS type A sorting domain-containing protein [Sphingobacteriaceae bacterium]|nr:T9SS type A sorting domain-containing protein [Sphingobacteriaceae bacterium]